MLARGARDGRFGFRRLENRQEATPRVAPTATRLHTSRTGTESRRVSAAFPRKMRGLGTNSPWHLKKKKAPRKREVERSSLQFNSNLCELCRATSKERKRERERETSKDTYHAGRARGGEGFAAVWGALLRERARGRGQEQGAAPRARPRKLAPSGLFLNSVECWDWPRLCRIPTFRWLKLHSRSPYGSPEHHRSSKSDTIRPPSKSAREKI